MEQDMAILEKSPGLKKTGRESKGLCSTCIHCSDCAFCSDSTAPIFQCEEFESKSAAIKTVIKNPVTVDITDENLKGLCRNCENRKTCTFKKPESGIWHCEEYR